MSHSIIRLPVHCPGQQLLMFNDTDLLENVIDRSVKTKLTEFFTLNRMIRQYQEEHEDDDAHILCRYMDLPRYYTWKTNAPGGPRWERRKQRDKILGRVNMVPTGTEQFYLRILLNHIEGPTSFQDLLLYNGVLAATFKDSCVNRGLLEDDSEWDACMAKSQHASMPNQMRILFSTIIAFGPPNDVQLLLHKYIEGMSENWSHLNTLTHNAKAIENIEMLLQHYNKTIHNYCTPNFLSDLGYPHHLEGELELDDDDVFHDMNNETEVEFDNNDINKLNECQKKVFDEITHSVLSSNNNTENDLTQNKLFFVDGPGGTGKSFTFNTILGHLKAQGIECMALATTGIAACLLLQGSTAHSALKIPLKLHEQATCNISVQSAKGKYIRDKVRLIILDKASMVHKHAIEAVDRTLQDITGIHHPMGNIAFVFGGDF